MAYAQSSTQVGFRVVIWSHQFITSPATGMTLKVISPGKFTMGSPPGEAGHVKDEEPPREVVISKPFWMGRHEVTVGQFRAFVNDKKYQTEAETTREGARRLFPGNVWKLDPAINWNSPGFAQTDDHPVVGVSWNDAVAFCEWLSQKEGKSFALPTEAQWEFCCRASKPTRFTGGNDDKVLDQLGWYGANAKGMTHPVGQKTANNWDLCDMHGNAWEWCADWYAPTYDRAQRYNPTGPKSGTPMGGSGPQRVVRGGSWATPAPVCRSARRGHSAPSDRTTQLGFRVVQLPETDLTNTIGMKLKLMPAQSFMMGSPGNEWGRNDKDEPQHEVAIPRPFFMGVYKVTVGQFKAFVKETDYQTEGEKNGKGALGLIQGNQWRFDPKRNWRNPGFEQTDDHPVVGVTWNDAKAFCAWLSKKEGRHYRLPTEAQWEFACRAGKGTRFFFDNNEKLMDEYAWFGGNSGMKTHPVGQKTPNAWALYDMYGNAAEITNDRYGADYYRTSPKEDPPGPLEGENFSRRGGGWYHAPIHCRSARREARALSHCIVDQGFRVVLLW
jgi:formylglycine-generating enzyme required for sulfatase activity